MRRGFKTQAEKASLSAREALKLGPHDALNPWDYAEHLGIVVLDFHKLNLSAASVRQLLHVDSDSWSAMTLKEGDTTAIVLNPAHAETRLCNDLMHELAHLDLGHIPSRVEVSKSGVLLLSDFSEEQEFEADWYAAALLLPRTALIRLRGQRKTPGQIAQLYGVSESLCQWRLRMTGVDIQLSRGRQAS